ncbi:MAG: hypothetical protein Q8M26_14705 [Pseudolabrys sp.]|nr:hypothetical protein [Pseudolabrys sp.]
MSTGDDFEHFGFAISPDLDTVMYTLAGIATPELGWGIAGESWSFMEQSARLGGPTQVRVNYMLNRSACCRSLNYPNEQKTETVIPLR